MAIAFAWRMQGWHDQVYEGLPGILIPTLIGLAISHKAPARTQAAAASADPAGEPAAAPVSRA